MSAAEPESANFPAHLDSLGVVDAARFLVGNLLVRNHPERGEVRCVITETEAYDEDDPASHCYNGESDRNLPMFRETGTLYVYLSYGVHHCLNVSVEGEGRGAAVLFRRLVALPPDTDLRLLGPGLIGRNLEIDLDYRGLDLLDPENGEIWLEPWEDRPALTDHLDTGKRIGISKATERPWRFFLERDEEERLLESFHDRANGDQAEGG